MTTLWLATRLAAAGGRLRTVSVVGCAALVTVLVVALSVLTELWIGAEAATRFLSEDDRRLPLAVVAALGLPVLALLATTTRLSASIRDRRLAALRVLGVGATRTRAVAATEAALLAGAGVLVGLAVVLLAGPAGAWQIAGVLPGIDPAAAVAVQVPTAGWWAATAGVVAASALVALLPTDAAVTSAVATTRQALPAAPSRWRLLPVTAGAVLLLVDPAVAAVAERAGSSLELPSTAALATFVAGAGLTGVGIPLAVPVVIRGLAGVAVRHALPTTGLLAPRRLQLEPASSTRTVAALLVGVFVITGALGVLRAAEAIPTALRAERAVTTGPQSIAVFTDAAGLKRTTDVPDDPDAGLAALAAMPQVHAVSAYRPLGVACPDGRRDAAGSPTCAEAVVATCAELPALAIDVTGCVDGAPAWVIPDRTFDDYSLTVPPALLEGPPVLATIGDDGTTITARLPLQRVDTHLSLPKDPGDPFWGPTSALLVVPPTTPGVDELLGPVTSYRVTADGGLDTLTALNTTATTYGLETLSTIPGEYAQLQLWRALFLSLAAVVLGLGLIALLATGIDHAITRRRHLATLTTVGVPAGVVRTSQFLQAAAPLLIGLPAAGALGHLTTIGYLSDSGFSAPPSTATATTVVLTTLAIGVLVAAITVTGLGRAPSHSDLRRE